MVETGQQLTRGELFRSRSTGTARRRARHDGPAASKEAAARLQRSGRLQRELDAALQAVVKHPAETARRLHERTGLSTHLLGRRLPDLAGRGLVVRVPHYKPFRWSATELGRAHAATLPGGAIAECRERTPREERLEAALRETHQLLDGAGIPSEYDAPEHPTGRRPYRLASRVSMLIVRVSEAQR